MKTIYKYKIGRDVVQMPQGAELLHVAYVKEERQHGDIFVWALVDTTLPLVRRTLLILGTGWDIEVYRNPVYVGTVHQNEYVWHIFDGGEKEIV